MSLRALREEVAGWRREGRPVALATVAKTWGSAPCPVGSVLAVAAPAEEDGLPGLAGAVSGGCVEAAVIEAALGVLAGAPPRLLRFGVRDETARAQGLACGGTIEVWLEPMDERADRRLWWRAADEGRVLRRLVLLEDGGDASPGAARASMREDEGWRSAGSLGTPELDAAADRLLEGEASGSVRLAGVRALLLHEASRGPLILVGAGQIAQHLVAFAGRLDFDVVLVDPRAAFLAEARFPRARRVLAWPTAEALRGAGLGPAASLVALAHDPKIDEPALAAALDAGAAYVGALGSAASHAARLDRLRARGLDEARLARIRGPVGLDIGARTPAEIALAISAELVAARPGAP